MSRPPTADALELQGDTRFGDTRFGDALFGDARFDVRRVRERMRITQREFAHWFGFPVATLRHWERGNRLPTGSALVLLHVIRDNPRVVRQAVIKARRANPAAFPAPERPVSHRAPPGFGQRPPAIKPRGPRLPRERRLPHEASGPSEPSGPGASRSTVIPRGEGPEGPAA